MPLKIGIPKERHISEYRVGLTPVGVSILTKRGHQCYVEKGAGVGSNFSDTEFEQAGARITYDEAEVFRRADIILKVQRPTEEEMSWMADHQTIMAFMMLAVTPPHQLRLLEEKGTAVVSYERIEERNGMLPVLYPLSQIGGRMTAQIAAQYLQNNRGGKGILLGGVAGVPPADVVIIGAGVVGMNAAQAFLGMGARIILLDHDLQKLQTAHEYFDGRITTMVSHDANLKKVCKFADVLVGAVQIPGEPAPHIITKEMVASMRPGSVVIDMSIDQGGCIETSRPMQHNDPIFMVDGVVHYCVPNLPGVVGRTSTHALLNAAWPFIQLVAEHGIEQAVELNAALHRGTVIFQREKTPEPA